MRVNCYKSSDWFNTKGVMRSLFLKHRRKKRLNTMRVMESEQTNRNRHTLELAAKERKGMATACSSIMVDTLGGIGG